MPNFSAYDQVVDHALPIIADRPDELRLRERVVDLLRPSIGGAILTKT
jgi:hypothetical protein